MQDQVTVTDQAAALAFASPIQAKIIQTLIGAEMAASTLARIVQLPLNLLHYHLSKCIALGLVQIVREQPRAGRAVKHYRASAKTYYVPSDLISKLPGAEMTRQLREALDRHQARTVEGVEYSHDGHSPCILLSREPASRLTATELWLDIGLARQDAKALIADLQSLLERYRSLDRKNEPRYLVHLAAVKAD